MCRLPHKTCLMSFIIVHPLNESSWTNQERGWYAKSFMKSFNWRHQDLAAVRSVASIVAIPTRCMISDGGQASMTPKRVQQQKKHMFLSENSRQTWDFHQKCWFIFWQKLCHESVGVGVHSGFEWSKKRAREFRQPFKQGSTKDSPWRFYSFSPICQWFMEVRCAFNTSEQWKRPWLFKSVFWGQKATQLCGD